MKKQNSTPVSSSLLCKNCVNERKIRIDLSIKIISLRERNGRLGPNKNFEEPPCQTSASSTTPGIRAMFFVSKNLTETAGPEGWALRPPRGLLSASNPNQGFGLTTEAFFF
jgi:hypothetical protein